MLIVEVECHQHSTVKKLKLYFLVISQSKVNLLPTDMFRYNLGAANMLSVQRLMMH